MNNTVMDQVKELLMDYFDDEDIEITESTAARDIDGWDSLAHISILAALEDRFHIKFSIYDSQQMKCVGDMVDIIANLIDKK